ncbi:MAG: HD domain-containing protein [Theionarchaea archaeon]|nr:HD domain-containing protein [Theionarchaea archaeon]
MNLHEYLLKFPELQLLYNRVKEKYEHEKPIHHNWTHVLRDLGKAILLGEREQVKMKIVIAGILLHDIGRLHPNPEGREHYEIGAHVAPGYLKGSEFTEEETDAVIHCVLSNGPRGRITPETREAQICYDVDFSCSAGYVGVGRAFHHFMGEENMNVKQIAGVSKERIIPKKQLLTDAGREFYEGNLRKAKEFWEEYDKEVIKEEELIRKLIPDYESD